jgi:hypothetical protein
VNTNAQAVDRTSNVEEIRGEEREEIKRSRNAPSIDRYESIVPENTKVINDNEVMLNDVLDRRNKNRIL